MNRPAPNGPLAINLRARRNAKKLSQHQLAKESGVARSTIVRIEAGHLASLRIVTALAGSLGVTPEQLLRSPEKRTRAAKAA